MAEHEDESLATLADCPKGALGQHLRPLQGGVPGAVGATPKAVNLRGRKPRVLQEGVVYIGRASSRSGPRASKWANPFMTERDGAREEVIGMYERWLRGERPDLMAALCELAARTWRAGARRSSVTARCSCGWRTRHRR
jgi:hypothetical protein